MQKIVIFVKKKKKKQQLEDKHAKDKKHYKVRDDCHYTGE